MVLLGIDGEGVPVGGIVDDPGVILEAGAVGQQLGSGEEGGLYGVFAVGDGKGAALYGGSLVVQQLVALNLVGVGGGYGSLGTLWEVYQSLRAVVEAALHTRFGNERDVTGGEEAGRRLRRARGRS